MALLGAGMTLASPRGAVEGEVTEPSGYRMEDYRAPAPQTLAGARVTTTAQTAELWRGGEAVFVDVMPHLPKPEGLPAGTVWRDKVRNNIPGSIWLPNVGYGALSPETAAYFRDGLATVTGDDKERTVVVYCLTDCWMSWNAAKRAIEWGYRSVVWYPAGADGWESEALPLVKAEPWKSQ